MSSRRGLFLASLLVLVLTGAFVRVVSSPLAGGVIVATDSDVARDSLATVGGQNLFQDEFGKFVAVYVDRSGRLGVVFCNGDPAQEGAWSFPAKSPTTPESYVGPAGVLVSASSLRILAQGGAGTRYLVDVPVSIARDSANNIDSVSFGPVMIIDSSGLAEHPAAILAHDGSIIVVWNVRQTGSFSRVNSMRWTTVGGWSSVSSPSAPGPDVPVLDSVIPSTIFPAVIERPDTFQLALVGNRGETAPSSSTLVFNTATFNGNGWDWGQQNLTYETNVARGVKDAPDVVWDPVHGVVLVLYDVSGELSYGILKIDQSGVKVHSDTPVLNVADTEWGSIAVDSLTGDYYLLMVNAASGSAGVVGWTSNKGGSWNLTLTIVDPSTENEAVSIRRTGAEGLDLIYSRGTSPPATIFFARIYGGPVTGPGSASITLTRSPNQTILGEEVMFTGRLRDTSSGVGLPGRTVHLRESSPSMPWSTLASVVTGSNGSFSASASFSLSGTHYLRAAFDGDAGYQIAVSPTIEHVVAAAAPHIALVAGNDGTLYWWDEAALTSVASGTARDLLEVGWRHDGAYALLVGRGNTVLKYDGAALTSVATGLPTVNWHTVSWKPDDSEAWIAGSDGTVAVYDGQRVTQVQTGLTLAINCFRWNPTGTVALLAGTSGLVARFDGGSFTTIASGTTLSLNGVGWHPSGDYALVGGVNATLLHYDGVSLTGVPTRDLFIGDAHQINSIQFNERTGVGLVTGNDGLVVFYDGGTVVRLREYRDFSGALVDLHLVGNMYQAAYVPGEDYAYSVGFNGAVLRINMTDVVLVSQGVTPSTLKSIVSRFSLARLFASAHSSTSSVSPYCLNACWALVGSNVSVAANPYQDVFYSWSAFGVSCMNGSYSRTCVFVMPYRVVFLTAVFAGPSGSGGGGGRHYAT